MRKIRGLTPVLIAVATLVSAQDAGLVPQARPVFAWLTAVNTGNLEQLKGAFSTAMQRQFELEGWSNVMARYQGAFRKAFGEYAVADFRFEFVGGEDSGEVNIVHKGNKLPPVRVIRESAGWKVDER